MTGHADRVAALTPAQRDRLSAALKARASRPELPTADYDVVVLGGGVAGLTLALQLAQTRPQLRLLMLEKNPYPVPETTHKVGESTVEIAAHYLRDVLGLADHLSQQQIRKFGLRMFFTAGDNTDIADRVEVGSSVFPPLCTYQLDRGRLENEMWRRCVDAGVHIETPAPVRGVTSPAGQAHTVTFEAGGVERSVTAVWVIDASGRSQYLRRSRGQSRLKNGHNASAAWLRVAHPIDVRDWSTDPEWAARIPEGDRSLSTNHLLGDGYWVWLIRLATGSTSVGIVIDTTTHQLSDINTEEKFLAWLGRREPQLADLLTGHRDQIQDFRVMGDYSYDCPQVFNGAERWCLTGESGLFLDPLYSPGLDLIAISNNLVADLIGRAVDGEETVARAAIHDTLFRSIADIWLAIYRDQYRLLRNARVMSSKVIWDTAFYWGVFGTLFFNDKLRDLADNPRVANDLSRLTLISNRMQLFFREWDAIDDTALPATFVDLYSPLNFMVTLHEGMAADVPDGQFPARFSENVRLLSQLAGQLMSTVIGHYSATGFDDATITAIQAWQRDPLVGDLIATYHREQTRVPASPGWISLTSPTPAHALVPAATGPTDWDRNDVHALRAISA